MAYTADTAATSGHGAHKGYHRARLSDIALTLIAPITWGTTYVVTTELLPPDRPLLASLLRALPAGLLLLAITRQLPRGDWWWKAAVLGTLNFGAFFPLLFLAAYRLPGGVAATIAAVQPLIVLAVAYLVFRTRPTLWSLGAALAGVLGVGLLVLTAAGALDTTGVIAQLTGITMMGTAIVLAKKWGRPQGTSMLSIAGWQMTMGGLMLIPVALIGEGIPPSLTGTNILGYAYLTIIGGALAYVCWFRGIERLPSTSVVFLGLANPMTATLAGLVILGQTLTAWQTVGFVIALAAMVTSQVTPNTKRHPT
ncbi:EamA family transporter [Hoyosella sp. YIM 151337]|uniref:EamA family transporter n=1 Tax=Hoyosella sp. YIM 151337 TaxID=2992742 RepID=UPI002235AF53|nr:EamA family transporter [Hoyosella sp. YIM 151337]MCW4352200.1 EamA family transporter [Hoyosella sp. YIM 151337]